MNKKIVLKNISPSNKIILRGDLGNRQLTVGRIRFLLIFLFVFRSGITFGTELRFTYLNTNKGLSNNLVNCINQDDKGYIWIGTAEGLNRYDGYNTRVFKKVLNDTNSLADNSIYSIYIDNSKNLWIGTQNGLCLFHPDKGNFSTYILDTEHMQLNTANRIVTMGEDSNHRLYTAVELGSLFYYDTLNKSFVKFNTDFKSIKDFLIDRDNNIWLGGKNGFYYFDPVSDSVRNFKYYTGKYGKESLGTINTLMDDGDTVWIGTLSGKVCYFLKKTLEIREFTNSVSDILFVYDIYKTHDGLIYICTASGIYVYNKHSEKVIHYSFSRNNPSGLNSYGVTTLFEDRQNDLWFGTVQGGVDLAVSGKDFRNYNAFSKRITLDVVNIHTIMEDHSGNLWIGSFDNGINVIDPVTGKRKLFLHNDKDPRSLGYGSVYAIFEDRDNTIWVGTYLGYLQRYNPANNTFTSYPFDPKLGENSKGKDIRSIIQDDDGNLWLLAHGNGMAEFSPSSGYLKHYYSDINDLQHSLPDNWAFQLLYDHEKYIWIATPSGLSRFNPKTGIFRNFFHNDKDPTSLCDNMINDMLEDSQNNLWIGTSFGLDLYERKRGRFVHFFERDGLPSNNIKCILEYRPGELWISTGQGLSRMRFSIDKSNGNVKATFRNFDQSDNLQDSYYWERSGIRTRNGELVFGGEKGIVMFNPDNIKINKRKPNVYITGIKLFNRPLRGADSLFLTKHPENNKIVLKYDQNFVTIEYVAINYISNGNDQYAYKLDGFNKSWIQAGNKREATFTNLDPGTYIFRVKASNNDGVWNNKGTTIKLVILPPFWMTIWFRVLVGIVIVSLLVFSYLYRITGLKKANIVLEEHVKDRTDELSKLNRELVEKNEWISRQNHEILEQSREIFSKNDRISTQNKLLEEQKEKIEKAYKELSQYHTQLEQIVEERTKELQLAKEKAEESDKLKSSFLSNLSHEIRTPLNSIIGFSNLVFDANLSEQERLRFKSIVDKNSNLLLKLINDIIDFSQIESEKIEIFRNRFLLGRFLDEFNEDLARDLLESSERNSDIVDFRLKLDKQLGNLEINTDELRLKQILGNLIGNAFKFTSKGYVELGCRMIKNGNYLEFYVKDTGIGIKKEHQKIIFERFRKVEEDKNTLYRGTGLGLSISMHLVHSLGGEIWVESEPGTGSVFFFTLPVDKEKPASKVKKKNGKHVIPNFRQSVILVAEDDAANYAYIEKLLLKTEARVLHAVDGRQTLEMYRENPDIGLILMDIKMPEMSGIDAMKELKKLNIKIPVIAQTAYAFNHEVQKIMGEGFDGYISKPIRQEDLFSLLKKHMV